jgi:hypothetical protein
MITHDDDDDYDDNNNDDDNNDDDIYIHIHTMVADNAPDSHSS